MIFFVLLSFWLLLQNRWVGSSAVLALGIGTKLLPLIFLPLLVRYLGWKRGLLYASVTFVFTAVLFLPFLSLDLFQNVFSSLNLYFQKFEFNASVYYLIRAAGYWLEGYNIISGAGFVLFILIGLGRAVPGFSGYTPPAQPRYPGKSTAHAHAILVAGHYRTSLVHNLPGGSCRVHAVSLPAPLVGNRHSLVRNLPNNIISGEPLAYGPGIWVGTRPGCV